jgi:hypothetical protein
MTRRPAAETAAPRPPRALALAFLALAACTEVPPAGPGQPASTAAPPPGASATADPAKKDPPPWDQRGLERLQADARRLMPVVQTEGVKLFLSRVATELPKIPKRMLYRDEGKTHYYTEAQAAALPPDARAKLVAYPVDEEEYYDTHYGSPLSYSRPLDILFGRGVTLPAGSKMLDFGYGYAGHLRLLASMGVQATGVDVWPLLPALYSFPGDQGQFTGPLGEKGSVRLLDGRFPADPAIVSAVGTGYTLILSKNVLKRGYLHPERPVADPKKLIHLDVSDEVAIKAFYDALVPGGHFMIYNICPAPTPPDKPFVPWSDGRSPFTKAQLEAAGFEVLVFDKDDAEAVRVMGRALGWDQTYDGEPGMDLVNDLSVLYTLVRKPSPPVK